MVSLKIESKVNLHTSYLRKEKARLFSLLYYHSKRLIKKRIVTEKELQEKLKPLKSATTINQLLRQLNLLKSLNNVYSFNLSYDGSIRTGVGTGSASTSYHIIDGNQFSWTSVSPSISSAWSCDYSE